jgi:hypothetical protein
MTRDYEKLGVFYLGRQHDLAERKSLPDKVLYDSKDLVTHAVCVGMTGSGKTGLCLALLEEAAMDGIPAIIIDPKGDLGNLLLTFPRLLPEDFAPWINPDDARRKNLSEEEYARAEAEKWSKGLQSWDQDGQRIAELREKADFAIYTPGSNAGLGVSILASFAAPAKEVLDDDELLRDRIATTATSLLGLLGMDADPIQSREHILISNLLGTAWNAGKDMDLAGLISQIQQPPFQRVGVMDLESFFPSKDRFGLAMKLNNLLAAPGFEQWLTGEPLDIRRILHTESGKPRMSIFSIAHLSDPQRMFFVSLLLNQILGWMRAQSGTTSLRAILYMDEIFGYFPPSANPPSKGPLLTLLKQARAFGLGVVLSTQNPVDLDYKGLANCGTWFIGRLQTERDKARLLDGLEGASGGSAFNRQAVEKIMSALGNRVFLMNNVHDDGPTVFETRWVMSYLRGPLTRNQIRQLMGGRSGEQAQNGTGSRDIAPPETPAKAPAPAPTLSAERAPAASVAGDGARPVLPPTIRQVFIPSSHAKTAHFSLYTPAILGQADVTITDAKADIRHRQQVSLLAPMEGSQGAPDWERANELAISPGELLSAPEREDARYAPPSGAASVAKNYDAWGRLLQDHVFRTCSLRLFRSPSAKQTSRPGESEADFRIRMAHAMREQRDELLDKLRAKYAPKQAALAERKRRAEQQLAVQKDQARASKVSAALSFGASVLGAVLGRKAVSAGNLSKVGTATRGVGRASKEAADVDRAQETVESIDRQIEELEQQFQKDVEELRNRTDPTTERLETIEIRPKKTDIRINLVALAWVPAAEK